MFNLLVKSCIRCSRVQPNRGYTLVTATGIREMPGTWLYPGSGDTREPNIAGTGCARVPGICEPGHARAPGKPWSQYVRALGMPRRFVHKDKPSRTQTLNPVEKQTANQ